MTQKNVIPEEPPFGSIMVHGESGVGKTLTSLNSPYPPILIFDLERSSLDYYKMRERLIREGWLTHDFTRIECLTYEQFMENAQKVIQGKQRWGTIIIDTVGQLTDWAYEVIFGKYSPDKVNKQSQVIWGEVRRWLRGFLLKISNKADLVILTAHDRKYSGEVTPRANPALRELCSVTVHLVRPPNAKLPAGEIRARLPYFGPRIPNFSIAELVKKVSEPVDWDNLSEEQKVPAPVFAGGDEGEE